jgi:hypothetical protein
VEGGREGREGARAMAAVGWGVALEAMAAVARAKGRGVMEAAAEA